MSKSQKPIELGKFSQNQEKKNTQVLTGTKTFGAPADNYSSNDIGKRKKPANEE